MKVNYLEFMLMNNPLRTIIQERYELPKFLDVKVYKRFTNILEIGCGNGNGAKLINKYFQPNSIYGIDIDERMITRAKMSFPKGNFSAGDVIKLDFKNNYFDAIFDFGVIHHIPNWKDCLPELYRVLRKGGYIFIEDFSLESYESPMGQLVKKLTDHPYKSMYKYAQFVELIRKMGFKIIKEKTYFPFGTMSYFVIIGVK